MKHSFFTCSALATAALLCLAGGAQAQSSVTIYGAIGLDVLSASKVYNGSTTGSVVKIDDNAIVNSRIGVKGVEDLGGGLKAVFDLESSVHPDTGSGGGGTFWNRGAYVGLAGDFGSLKLGHQWNVADDYMGNFFVYGYYSPFLMSGFGALSDYYDNAIKYNSPNLGGFEGGLYYAAGEKTGMRSAGQKVQGAAIYTAGPFCIGLTAFSEKDPFGVYKGNTMYGGGLSYDFGVLKTRLGLASAEVNYLVPPPGTASTNVGAFKAKLIDVGIDVPITQAFSASVDYVKKDVNDSPDGTSYTRGRLSYALSKRTSLNANLIFSRNSGNANFAFVSQADPNNPFAGQIGQKQTLVTAGITHSF